MDAPATSTHLVLVGVVELRVHHVYDAASVRSHVEAKLLLPGPGVRAADPRLAQLLHHADVVDDVQDQGLQLQLQHAGLCTERRRVRSLSVRAPFASLCFIH